MTRAELRKEKNNKMSKLTSTIIDMVNGNGYINRFTIGTSATPFIVTNVYISIQTLEAKKASFIFVGESFGQKVYFTSKPCAKVDSLYSYVCDKFDFDIDYEGDDISEFVAAYENACCNIKFPKVFAVYFYKGKQPFFKRITVEDAENLPSPIPNNTEEYRTETELRPNNTEPGPYNNTIIQLYNDRMIHLYNDRMIQSNNDRMIELDNDRMIELDNTVQDNSRVDEQEFFNKLEKPLNREFDKVTLQNNSTKEDDIEDPLLKRIKLEKPLNREFDKVTLQNNSTEASFKELDSEEGFINRHKPSTEHQKRFMNNNVPSTNSIQNNSFKVPSSLQSLKKIHKKLDNLLQNT